MVYFQVMLHSKKLNFPHHFYRIGKFSEIYILYFIIVINNWKYSWNGFKKCSKIAKMIDAASPLLCFSLKYSNYCSKYALNLGKYLLVLD